MSIKAVVSYFPSSNKIFNIYNSIEEARKDVKLLNLFSMGGEKLQVGEAELSEDEYRSLTEEDE